MVAEIFNKEYTKYWEEATVKSVDGTLIAGPNEANSYLEKLLLTKIDKALDLGCSYGRMGPMLSNYAREVYGVDPDKFALSKAILNKYKAVTIGSAEEINFPNEMFDLVFCWAVFDVVNQFKSLVELARVLKNKGKAVVTGKNVNYLDNDKLGFNAEKNAFLKGFPTKFTDLNLLLKVAKGIGLKPVKIICFKKRGDMGTAKSVVLNLKQKKPVRFYEYLVCLEKTKNSNRKEEINLSYIHSNVSIKLAKKNGYESVSDFFNSIGIS